jgi:hypothetical protein
MLIGKKITKKELFNDLPNVGNIYITPFKCKCGRSTSNILNSEYVKKFKCFYCKSKLIEQE